MAGIATLAAWVTILAAIPGASSEDLIVHYDRESRYYRIQVVDYPAKGRRCLHFSKSRGIQSSMILADPARLDLKYSQTMIAALALHREPRDVLLVGLGGASIPKFLQKYFPELELDIVELDPDVVRVCQDYFEFRGNAKTRVFVMDGRMYLKRAEKQYDLILLDAYAADHMPFHLTTVEFIQLVKSHLKPGGVAASNLWEKAINRFYLAELKTFQATFPQVYLLPAAQTGNIIVFGTMAEEPVTRKDWVLRAEERVRGRDIGFNLADLIGREYRCLTDRKIDEAVLTDDKAPVNTLRHEHPKHFEEEGASP
ncbi:MAG: fused MFS/spermidine synthase [Phycisphaerae bacterium]